MPASWPPAMVLATGWRLFGQAALTAAGLEPSEQNRYVERVAQYVQLLGRNEIGPEPAQPQKPTLPTRKSRTAK